MKMKHSLHLAIASCATLAALSCSPDAITGGATTNQSMPTIYMSSGAPARFAMISLFLCTFPSVFFDISSALVTDDTGTIDGTGSSPTRSTTEDRLGSIDAVEVFEVRSWHRILKRFRDSSKLIANQRELEQWFFCCFKIRRAGEIPS